MTRDDGGVRIRGLVFAPGCSVRDHGRDAARGHLVFDAALHRSHSGDEVLCVAFAQAVAPSCSSASMPYGDGAVELLMNAGPQGERVHLHDA